MWKEGWTIKDKAESTHVRGWECKVKVRCRDKIQDMVKKVQGLCKRRGTRKRARRLEMGNLG